MHHTPLSVNENTCPHGANQVEYKPRPGLACAVPGARLRKTTACLARWLTPASALAALVCAPLFILPAGLEAQGAPSGSMGAEPLIWMIAAANSLTAVSYFSISLALAVFVNRRKDIPFSRVFIMFGAFILACGITHVVHTIGLWMPVDELQVVVDTLCALISAFTAVALWPLLPRFLAIPSPEQLRVVNRALLKEKAELERTQDELRKAYAGVEQRVIERTADLARANQALQAEISERIRAEQQTREKTAELDRIFSLSLDLLCVVDADGRFVRLNPAWEQVLGYRPDELEGQKYVELLHPDDIAATEQVAVELSAGREVIDFTNRYRRRDGTYRWIEWRSKPYERQMIYAVARDITGRKQAEEEIRLLNATLEQRVQERTTQLSAVNKELESFSYSVSHDLRSPLRALEGFSAALLKDYAGNLDDQGRHYLERIQISAQRMGQLINDLLSLSRVTRTDFKREPVDLSAMALDIASSLQAQDAQRQVQFDIAPGLAALGDAHLLRIALQNLMDNAYKFSGKRALAYIQVGMLQQNGEAVYFVRDNGAGFDMAYAGKLFGAFQRLHGMQEFSGTGIGLVTVQRIIQRHGGRIWPEAEVDRGATFYFTLGER
jgi:PAS domain S-box-containing protein